MAKGARVREEPAAVIASGINSRGSSSSRSSRKVSDGQVHSTEQLALPIVRRVSPLIKALASKAVATGAGGEALGGASSMHPRIAPWPRASGSVQSTNSENNIVRTWNSPRTAKQDGA